MPRLSAIMPAIPVRNLDGAMDFYRSKLGFSIRHREEGSAIVVRDTVELHLTRLEDESWRRRPDFVERPVKSGAESFLPGTASVRIRVEDVATLYAEYAAQGALRANATLCERSWGDIDFGVVDLDGNLMTFYEPMPCPRGE